MVTPGGETCSVGADIAGGEHGSHLGFCSPASSQALVKQESGFPLRFWEVWLHPGLLFVAPIASGIRGRSARSRRRVGVLWGVLALRLGEQLFTCPCPTRELCPCCH